MCEFGSRLVRVGALLAGLCASTAFAQAPSDTAVKISWSAFVDSYYAWDFGQPPSFDRSFAGGAPFTTQPARHNEFNVNLAFVEAKIEGARVRGRLALQAGTSVQSNYLGEPGNGVVSGPALSRLVQEAVAGLKIGENSWVDAGIFFSHLGMEGWISRDNPMYTRSLVADYSPYYQSGVKLTTTRGRLTAQLDVVNGWQNISENNTGKGVGVRLDFTPSASTTLSYYNLFSDEAGNQLRTFNGVGIRTTSGSLTFVGQFDYGTQARAGGAEGSSWYGALAALRAQVSPRTAVVGRVERYDDEDGVIVATGVGGTSFRANGLSLGIDHSPMPRVQWRTEGRFFSNESAVFPDGNATVPKMGSAFLVTSLALTM